jgi:hypothetical protein
MKGENMLPVSVLLNKDNLSDITLASWDKMAKAFAIQKEFIEKSFDDKDTNINGLKAEISKVIDLLENISKQFGKEKPNQDLFDHINGIKMQLTERIDDLYDYSTFPDKNADDAKLQLNNVRSQITKIVTQDYKMLASLAPASIARTLAKTMQALNAQEELAAKIPNSGALLDAIRTAKIAIEKINPLTVTSDQLEAISGIKNNFTKVLIDSVAKGKFDPEMQAFKDATQQIPNSFWTRVQVFFQGLFSSAAEKDSKEIISTQMLNKNLTNIKYHDEIDLIKMLDALRMQKKYCLEQGLNQDSAGKQTIEIMGKSLAVLEKFDLKNPDHDAFNKINEVKNNLSNVLDALKEAKQGIGDHMQKVQVIDPLISQSQLTLQGLTSKISSKPEAQSQTPPAVTAQAEPVKNSQPVQSKPQELSSSKSEAQTQTPPAVPVEPVKDNQPVQSKPQELSSSKPEAQTQTPPAAPAELVKDSQPVQSKPQELSSSKSEAQTQTPPAVTAPAEPVKDNQPEQSRTQTVEKTAERASPYDNKAGKADNYFVSKYAPRNGPNQGGPTV